MKKKIFLSLFVLLVLFGVTACKPFGLHGKGRVKVVQNVDTDNNTKNTKTVTAANIKETVIFDKDGVKVTAKSILYDGWNGPEIKVLIENNTSEDIVVQSRNFSVNGLMIDPILSATVAAGKKANDTISISESDLELSKITTIKDIEFDLLVLNADNWKTIMKEQGIKLQTNAKNYVQKYNEAGILAVDQDDVKIYVLKKDGKSSSIGEDVYVYVENNTSENIVVQVRDVSVNGFMIDPVFSSDIAAGKKIYDTMTFFDSQLEENDIKDIEEIELNFLVYNADSWKTIFKTDTKKISFK